MWDCGDGSSRLPEQADVKKIKLWNKYSSSTIGWHSISTTTSEAWMQGCLDPYTIVIIIIVKYITNIVPGPIQTYVYSSSCTHTCKCLASVGIWWYWHMSVCSYNLPPMAGRLGLCGVIIALMTWCQTLGILAGDKSQRCNTLHMLHIAAFIKIDIHRRSVIVSCPDILALYHLSITNVDISLALWTGINSGNRFLGV